MGFLRGGDKVLQFILFSTQICVLAAHESHANGRVGVKEMHQNLLHHGPSASFPSVWVFLQIRKTSEDFWSSLDMWQVHHTHQCTAFIATRILWNSNSSFLYNFVIDWIHYIHSDQWQHFLLLLLLCLTPPRAHDGFKGSIVVDCPACSLSLTLQRTFAAILLLNKPNSTLLFSYCSTVSKDQFQVAVSTTAWAIP